MKLVSKEVSLAHIRSLSVEEQIKMLKAYTDGTKKVTDQRLENKETVKVFGKVACEAEIRLNAAIQAGTFPANKSLASYIEDLTGQKPLTHGLTLKNAFGSFVIPGHITENCYDINSSNALELASRIVYQVKGDLTHEAVQRAIAELQERSDKQAANLRKILATLKPVTKMTPAEALEMLAQIRADGHLGMVIVQLPDEMTKLVEADQQSAFVAIQDAVNNVNTMFGAKADAWIEAMQNAAAPVTFTAGDPAAAPKDADLQPA